MAVAVTTLCPWASDAAPLSAVAAKAYDMAKTADEGAAAARQEGEAALKELQGLKSEGPAAEPLGALQAEAGQAQAALVGYEKQAHAASSEALQLLIEVTRVAAATPPDPVRREVLEQRAQLAAYEAAVMAARARAAAERLRALRAEARTLLATAGAGGAEGRPSRPAARPAAPATPEASGRDVEVPNLVGARLDAAARDLAAAGLRLGATTGPRDGFVVEQAPAAGARAARQTAVSVTLSATAAGVKNLAPR